MDNKRQRIEDSSNKSKKTRLNSEEECEKGQKKDENNRSKSVPSLILNLEDLPDEVILKLFSYLDNADLIRSGHLSKRLRAISSDESLWQKINLFEKNVPTSFLQFVLKRGCKYLSLHSTKLNGSLNLTKPTKLEYLNIKSCLAEDKTLEKLLFSCRALQKFAFSAHKYYSKSSFAASDMITSVCRQNKKTLKVLYLNIFHNWLNSSIIKNVFFSCTELKEVSIVGGYVGEDAINYLVKNLSPNVEKLRLDILVIYVVGCSVKGYKIRYIFGKKTIKKASLFNRDLRVC